LHEHRNIWQQTYPVLQFLTLRPASPQRVSLSGCSNWNGVRTLIAPTSSILSPRGTSNIHIAAVLADSGRVTNADGRCLDLLPVRGSDEAKREGTDLIAGQTYKIVFKTNEYFDKTNRKSFYPWVEVRSQCPSNGSCLTIGSRSLSRSRSQRSTIIFRC